MGRRPKSPKSLPHLRARQRGGKTWYYYDHGGKPRREEPLGSDYGRAIQRWAEIERASAEKPREVVTFRYVAERYLAEVVPTKAAATQAYNRSLLKSLMLYFDDPPCPLDSIEPQHVKSFLRWRGKESESSANRSKKLLSSIWNWAREQGYTALPNPCTGIKGFREDGRDVYIEDDLYKRVWDAASVPLRDAMDLAYLTGQRVADTLSMDERDIRDGCLHVKQGKTGTKRRIEVSGELRTLLDRISSRKAALVVRSTRLIIDESGQALTRHKLRGSFERARKTANVAPDAFQFRDLRAKAATDKTDTAGDIRQAQQQLGHASLTMTEHYVRQRRGAKVTPTK